MFVLKLSKICEIYCGAVVLTIQGQEDVKNVTVMQFWIWDGAMDKYDYLQFFERIKYPQIVKLFVVCHMAFNNLHFLEL